MICCDIIETRTNNDFEIIIFQSYREYHADIYPETNGMESALGPSDWWSGSDIAVPKINLVTLLSLFSIIFLWFYDII